MINNEFSIADLEIKLEELSSAAERVQFISAEINRCNIAVNDLKNEVLNYNLNHLRITEKPVNKNPFVSIIINGDENLRRIISSLILDTILNYRCDNMMSI